jgi:hypothetical protein
VPPPGGGGGGGGTLFWGWGEFPGRCCEFTGRVDYTSRSQPLSLGRAFSPTPCHSLELASSSCDRELQTAIPGFLLLPQALCHPPHCSVSFTRILFSGVLKIPPLDCQPYSWRWWEPRDLGRCPKLQPCTDLMLGCRFWV